MGDALWVRKWDIRLSQLGEQSLEVQEGGLNGATAERDGATELFTRHSAEIYRYCLRRLRKPEEAEDALQATYLNAWRSLKEGFQPDSPRPWLFQIAANVCTTTLRTKLGGTRLELREPEALENLIQVEQTERDAFLDLTEAVRDLPDRQRRALVLRDWQGLAYDEIAARMAVSDAAVETLLFRARSKVAAALASREWKPATSARALLLWPFSFLPVKSAATSGAAQLKAGLVLACGTVAPLVAFGLLHVLVFSPEERDARRTTVAAPSTQVEPAVSPVGDDVVSRPLTAAGRKEGSRSASGTKKGSGGEKKSENPRGDALAAPAQPSEVPPAQPPAAATPHAGQVVVCHQTGSGKNSGVTIQVDPHAAEHGLSKDPAGACN
jgi:RNA polymerase sigma factor (sigma-70 family)